MRRLLNGFLAGWHSIELFAVQPASRGLACVTTPALLPDLESLRWLYCGFTIELSNLIVLLQQIIRHWQLGVQN